LPHNSLKRIVISAREIASRQGWEEAVPNFDRDALKRSILALRSGNPSRHRSASIRNIQPELSAIDSQFRKEGLETLEGALTQAGIDVRKLRATLARNQKKSLDRVAALRPRAEGSQHPEPGVGAGKQLLPVSASARRARGPARSAIVAHVLDRAGRHNRQ
jgi:hypothetical protein